MAQNGHYASKMPRVRSLYTTLLCAQYNIVNNYYVDSISLNVPSLFIQFPSMFPQSSLNVHSISLNVESTFSQYTSMSKRCSFNFHQCFLDVHNIVHVHLQVDCVYMRL